MSLPDLPDYGIIDAHMHPYLAGHRDFPFSVPETYMNPFTHTVANRRKICALLQIFCFYFALYHKTRFFVFDIFRFLQFHIMV